MKKLKVLTIISLLLTTIFFILDPPKTFEDISSGNLPNEWFQVEKNPKTPKEHIRPGDQTFLTFPEWFLVHSPREEGEYLLTRTSSSFPFVGHLEQLWKSYSIVYKQIKNQYEFNYGYHVMILVISVSTTVEYGFKSIYENTIGRVTDTEAREEMTDEDTFQAKVVNDYVKFIMQTPWYEFNFHTPLIQLWTEIPFFGNNFIRKIERKFFLTTDLGIKAIYGWLIKKATKAAYEDPILGTVVIVDNLPTKMIDSIQILEDKKDYYILLLPRYADFNPAINYLASDDINFLEIAGNSSAILLTLLTDVEWKLDSNSDYKVIFSQPILTKPNQKRVAICVPVTKLSSLLRKLQKEKIYIEHIYDY